MESERQRSSTRNHIEKRELPINLTHLAISYVRENNDLRKTLWRFEQEKQKQMKSIDGDIWELHKFMQQLKCVTTMSAEDMMLFRQRKPKGRWVNTSRDKTLSANFSRTKNETSLTTLPNVTVTGQTPGCNQTKNKEPLPDNLNQQRNKFCPKCSRSSSVGDMSSATRERLRTSVNNQPLLNRRKSLVAVRYVQPLLLRGNHVLWMQESSHCYS